MSDPVTDVPSIPPAPLATPLPPPSTKGFRKSEVGDLRPSQALTTFGIGSLIDLPNLSVLVLGLDDWQPSRAEEISEERLLLSVQRVLGGQVTKLLTPPRAPESMGGGGLANWFDDAHTTGIPVAPFPRWLVCSGCRLLMPVSSGVFEPKVEPYRPDRTRYMHNCNVKGGTPTGRKAIALPARFLVACPNGHLDDFPWLAFVHRNKSGCEGPLELYEIGASGEASDVEVRCRKCESKRRMADAFGQDNQVNMPACRGRRPHLRDWQSEGCNVPHMRPILQGASNSWFAVTLTALSVPQAADKLAQLVTDHWMVLAAAQAEAFITAFRAIGQLKDFGAYTDAEVWEATQNKRDGTGAAEVEPTDLKTPEWAVFSDPASAPESKDFKLRSVEPPPGYEQYFERIVLVEKLREVRSLVGFTRIESPRDFDSPFELPKEKRAPLSRKKPLWVPASETRGEGIFFQFAEAALTAWTQRTARHDEAFRSAHARWRTSKNLPDPMKGYPGHRYLLLHSFAHAIIRQLSIECGYTAAALAERIYSMDPEKGDPMAGVLIYTAAPDSEGTLGGLCALGTPKKLVRHLDQALERIAFCASDPLCAEHDPKVDLSLHGAACHACSFLPETSCERGNRYLDRSVLIPTMEHPDLAFFEGH